MKLLSPAFAHDGPIPAQYTCDGENVSPPLEIADIPSGTRSLTIIVDDPDAPRGDWVHWLLWNIPPETRSIGEGKSVKGATEGTTDYGTTGYGGPCPPSGTHQYQFKLSALDTLLSLPPSSRKPDLERALEGHVLATARIVGRYGRSPH